jgi:integral membrane protein (TIGR00529 family)
MMTDLLKIVLIVLVLLFLIKKKWDLGFVLFIGTLMTGVAFRLDFPVFVRNVLEALISTETLSLFGIILLVLYLGNLLQLKGNFKKMVDSLKNLIPEPRLILALPSSFIGLLPMIGGALMSAPVVEEAGKRWKLTPAWKTFLNYWFRHIWEYSWPLYVNLILASAILQIPIKRIATVQFPFTVLAAILGLIILFKHVHRLPDEKTDGKFLKSLLNLILSIWPIFLVIVLIFVFKFSMLLALAATAVLTQVFFRMDFRERSRILWQSISLKTLFLIASVMVFKRILEVSGALESVTGVFQPEGISAYLLLFVVPFFLGLLTGVNHAYVGISFPILLPIFGSGNPDMMLVMFAYVSGFVGILLSPTHLCLVLTLDYYKADLKDVYKILLWPSVVIFIAAFLVLLFLRIL